MARAEPGSTPCSGGRNQQNELTLDLQRQIEELRRQLLDGGHVEEPTKQQTRAVLWVDDQPANNALLVEQLTAAGASVDLATSTSGGLAKAGNRTYGAVITDMGRTEGGRLRPQAGIDFVRELRTSGDDTPVLIFRSRRNVAARRQEALDAGAQGVTTSGGDLVTFLGRLGVVE